MMPDQEINPAEAERLAVGRWLFAQPCNFKFGVVDVSGLPNADLTEIAFAGRSNVGKSSLINALTGHKALARTSSTPGRTQELNFFTLAERDEINNEAGHALWMVDMPGYGYAKESKSKIAAWNKLLRSYLRGRMNLRRVFVLIDARHGLKSNDIDILNLLDEAAVSYQIVLTKADKPKQDALAATLQTMQTALAKRPAAHPEMIATSAVKGHGINLLQAEIAGLVDLPAIGYKT